LLVYRKPKTLNAIARLVTQKPPHLSSVDIIHELHWLPLQWRIKFKLASLTFKVTHTGTPLYLSRLLIPYCPSRVLRSSSSSSLLQVPHTNLIFGSIFSAQVLQVFGTGKSWGTNSLLVPILKSWGLVPPVPW